MNFDKDYVLSFAKALLNIDSPTGFSYHAITFLNEEATKMGYLTSFNEKGNLFIHVNGNDSNKCVGISAHCDTLGLMVRSIKDNGHLAITNIGGPLLPTLDGEYCRIITRDGKVYTGTILSTACAAHVYKDASTLTRDLENMEVRIDEIVKSKEDVIKLGIEHGDFIAIDPKVQITDNGFVKSRFLDDKISVALLFGILKYLKEEAIKPSFDLCFIVSTFEEVGHGSSHLPDNIQELLAVDMGCIGLDLACSEYDVSICAKDSSGPYDYQMTSKLIELAKQMELNYAVDIYPMYSSDVSAALKGGSNIRGALIGPGVHASHGMERTHYLAIENTMKLVYSYITSK